MINILNSDEYYKKLMAYACKNNKDDDVDELDDEYFKPIVSAKTVGTTKTVSPTNCINFSVDDMNEGAASEIIKNTHMFTLPTNTQSNLWTDRGQKITIGNNEYLSRCLFLSLSFIINRQSNKLGPNNQYDQDFYRNILEKINDFDTKYNTDLQNGTLTPEQKYIHDNLISDDLEKSITSTTSKYPDISGFFGIFQIPELLRSGLIVICLNGNDELDVSTLNSFGSGDKFFTLPKIDGTDNMQILPFDKNTPVLINRDAGQHFMATTVNQSQAILNLIINDNGNDKTILDFYNEYSKYLITPLYNIKYYTDNKLYITDEAERNKIDPHITDEMITQENVINAILLSISNNENIGNFANNDNIIIEHNSNVGYICYNPNQKNIVLIYNKDNPVITENTDKDNVLTTILQNTLNIEKTNADNIQRLIYESCVLLYDTEGKNERKIGSTKVNINSMDEKYNYNSALYNIYCYIKNIKENNVEKYKDGKAKYNFVNTLKKYNPDVTAEIQEQIRLSDESQKATVPAAAAAQVSTQVAAQAATKQEMTKYLTDLQNEGKEITDTDVKCVTKRIIYMRGVSIGSIKKFKISEIQTDKIILCTIRNIKCVELQLEDFYNCMKYGNKTAPVTAATAVTAALPATNLSLAIPGSSPVATSPANPLPVLVPSPSSATSSSATSSSSAPSSPSSAALPATNLSLAIPGSSPVATSPANPPLLQAAANPLPVLVPSTSPSSATSSSSAPSSPSSAAPTVSSPVSDQEIINFFTDLQGQEKDISNDIVTKCKGSNQFVKNTHRNKNYRIHSFNANNVNLCQYSTTTKTPTGIICISINMRDLYDCIQKNISTFGGGMASRKNKRRNKRSRIRNLYTNSKKMLKKIRKTRKK
jgi:hypothetical protein